MSIYIGELFDLKNLSSVNKVKNHLIFDMVIICEKFITKLFSSKILGNNDEIKK